jgi:hypothetical protein
MAKRSDGDAPAVMQLQRLVAWHFSVASERSRVRRRAGLSTDMVRRLDGGRPLRELASVERALKALGLGLLSCDSVRRWRVAWQPATPLQPGSDMRADRLRTPAEAGLLAILQQRAANLGWRPVHLAREAGLPYACAHRLLDAATMRGLDPCQRLLSACGVRLACTLADGRWIEVVPVPDSGTDRPRSGHHHPPTRRRRANGADHRPGRLRITKDEVVALYRSGMTYRAVAGAAGVSPSRIRQIIVLFGCAPARQRGLQHRIAAVARIEPPAAPALPLIGLHRSPAPAGAPAHGCVG